MPALRAKNSLATGLLMTNPRGAETLAREALGVARRVGLRGVAVRIASNWADAAFEAGEWRDVETILSAAARTLDFSKPVAVLVIAVLHFIPDADRPHEIMKRLLDGVPPGSYLVVQHAPSDIRADEMAESSRHYNAATSAAISARTHDEVARFFDGLEMIGPGLVDLPQWLAPEAPDSGVTSYVGIGRKPGTAS